MERICHALLVDRPEDREMWVCPETIYQALCLQAREVAAALRTGRTRRKPHRDPVARTRGSATGRCPDTGKAI
jgi:IS30 family transposase